MRARLFFSLLLALTMAFSLPAAADDARKPLDHDAYNLWHAIQGKSISPDGSWMLYSLSLKVGDGQLLIHNLNNDTRYTFERSTQGAFSHDSSHALFRIKPPLEEVRQAKREEKKKDDMPKDAMGIVNLATGELTTIDRIKSFKLPKKAGGWAAVLLEKPIKKKDKEDEDAANEPAEEKEPASEPAKSTQEKSQEEQGDADKKKDKDKKVGTELVLINLADGERRSFEHVVEYTFDEGAHFLAYTASTKAGDEDGIYVVDLSTGNAVDVMIGEGIYKSLAFDKAGGQLAFLTNRDDYEADQPEFTLHLWSAGEESSITLAAAGDAGVPDGWWVSEHHAPDFSESGDRLFFGLAPTPEPEPDADDPATPLEDELPVLDIWHWREPDLQTIQLNNLDDEMNRSYLAMVDLAHDERVVPLANESIREVEVGTKGDASIAVGVYDEPYRRMIQWDIQMLSDLYLVNVKTGKREKALEAVKAQPWRGNWLSPASHYIHYWDYALQAWMAFDTESRTLINLSEHIPHPVYNEDHDTPALAGPYGIAGWLDDDAGVLIYDRHDVWLVDPLDTANPRAITEGVGRDNDLRLRIIDLDPEEDAIDPGEPMLLSAFNRHNKNAGFYRDRADGSRKPQQLLMAARRFSTPIKAENADTLMLTRESFEEFPNLWAAGMDFSDMRQVSDANPQQADYLWGDSQLVNWTSARGEPLQGILYTPEDFDPDKQYPMMVYFYERNSDNLHRYSPPTPHRSIIRFSFYASRGYLVFVPDIVYQDGHPGRSAVECVMPGVTSLIDKGFVDPARIGMQGHSWGGYQSAYLITQTNLFAAAGSGAPVSNMTSAYGGIRWGSGLSRQFQYEQTQSRIGGTLWDKPMLYLENSPIFHLQDVTTPLLILHNDHDGAVPWYQGIELFMAMRRLEKPAWLLNYNDQPHWPMTYPDQRDYAIRMQQFFDHYLKGAPAPRWMTDGVPAVKKGKEFGLELVTPE